MTQAVKRACDACHRRKVKCDGINPCRNCSQAQLSCTYNAVPQKKGPKGSRAKVISELRETQRQTSLSAKVQNRINGVPSAPNNTSLAPSPGMLSGDLVKECVNFYFDHLYSQVPILDRRTIEQQVCFMEQNKDSYCLVTSLCAFVMLQPGMTMPSGDPFNLDMLPGANIVSSQLLVEETLKVRKGYEYLDSINLNVVATNYFLFACSYIQESHDRAWYYLREATTMIHLNGMHKEEHYMQFDPVESSRRRRLFWLLFATERAYAIQRNRPLTLQATINLPTVNDDMTDPMPHQLNGFVVMSNLFKPFDDAFNGIWGKARASLSPQITSSLQKQLTENVQSYLCQDSNFTDMHTNQQWLKSTIWQLTNSSVNGGTDDALSYQYPRELLMSMASQFQFPHQGIELMNAGLIEKLMEVTHSAIEFLSLQPAPRDPFTAGPREFMTQLLSIVAVTRSGDHRFLPLLLSKVSEIVPRFVSPVLQNAPENPSLGNIDIFDGFGTAGMAQPPPQMQLPMEADYDRKFSVEEYEKKYSMDMAGGTPESMGNASSSGSAPVPHQGTEINSSFTGSPGMMSPTVEYPPHGLNTFACTPMSEMVMSPLGHTAPQNPMSQAQHQPQHQPQPGHQHQHQHPQLVNQGHDAMRQHHMTSIPQGMHGQGMNTPAVPTSVPMNNMCNMRQPPQQRQPSFSMHDPRQYAGQPSMSGMNSMGNEMEFGGIS